MEFCTDNSFVKEYPDAKTFEQKVIDGVIFKISKQLDTTYIVSKYPGALHYIRYDSEFKTITDVETFIYDKKKHKRTPFTQCANEAAHIAWMMNGGKNLGWTDNESKKYTMKQALIFLKRKKLAENMLTNTRFGRNSGSGIFTKGLILEWEGYDEECEKLGLGQPVSMSTQCNLGGTF
jgi:hypothetical protein